MKNKPMIVVLAAVLILAAGIGIGAYGASNYGTQADPLVAKSYLDDTLTPALKEQFEVEVDKQVRLLEQQIASEANGLNFSVVEMSDGQTLKGNAGCEIVLRSGSAVGSGASGISDITDGSLVSNGTALKANHLCLVGTEGEGVRAIGAVTLLVRGQYSIS